ncbi:hypothetical protein F0562_001820 [Nyssa sinensis]|uniref:Uncharacterized protein n=1 Tax=Nyssa sinensis TaxID=561372 RepID=A0A5J5C5S0_9ASTE|nr:hypothetical protein F0562_001820 [Nyssa sinensis]
MSHGQGFLLQNLPQSEKGWDWCTHEIDGAWKFPTEESLYIVPSTCCGACKNANLGPTPYKTRKRAAQGFNEPTGKKKLVEKTPQVAVLARPLASIIISNPPGVTPSSVSPRVSFLPVPPAFSISSPVTVTAFSAALSVLSSSSPRPASPKELTYFLLDQKVMVTVVRIFLTPIDTTKLVEVRFPILEHHVCYDLTRAMVSMSEWFARTEDHIRVVVGLKETMAKAQPKIDTA